jgi:hypothetical protein
VGEKSEQKLPRGKPGDIAEERFLYDFSQLQRRKESQQRIIERLPYLV